MHICKDEVALILTSSLPLISYCWLCLKARFSKKGGK